MQKENRRITQKKRRSFSNLKLVLLSFLLVFLFAFTSKRNGQRFLFDTPVKFVNPEQPLITEQTVNKLLIQNKGSFKNIQKESLDLNRLEAVLNANAYVRKANVYVSVNGDVGVEIMQKTPLARVQNASSFYIDEEGKKMPTSPNFSVRVPLVTGKVTKDNLSEVFKLLKNIKNDVFFEKQIEGVIVNKNKFTLLTREFDFIIDFGTVENCTMKMKNFKAFYKKALKDKTLDKYSKVNLQIASQVVCTKK